MIEILSQTCYYGENIVQRIGDAPYEKKISEHIHGIGHDAESAARVCAGS